MQPRPRLENGRLRHRVPLASMPRPKPAEPIDPIRDQAVVDFYADTSPPPQEGHH